MILFFGTPQKIIYAVQTDKKLSAENVAKLEWLFGESPRLDQDVVKGKFIGRRKTPVSPWSTNAVEIVENMGVDGIGRIERYIAEEFFRGTFDLLLWEKFENLDQHLFQSTHRRENIFEVEDIGAYNQKEGLAMSDDEVEYLEDLAQKLKRPLTDSEVFGFSQVNSEHCRHKIFNGVFVIDGEEKERSLFQWIKKTSKENPNGIVSAYKDNVAFVKGPIAEQFAPKTPHTSDFYENKKYESVISLKAETHNFPTTVEPYNGAATGSGGEIRDRLAGGKGALPLAGAAVYMTAYSRLQREASLAWEQAVPEREWLYQSPLEILIKASIGASDYGNKFGQPLICGSILTFEHSENGKLWGYDKTIMQAGGIGYAKAAQALKERPNKGDQVVVLGGANYRIGMGGAAVSSEETGETEEHVMFNAVQRSNPEMQKRAANTIRAMVESDSNPIISVHDHGAGGHLNCLSELVEDTGGVIDLDKLPIGDPTLSHKEVIGNESQERMGLLIAQENLETLQKVAERERSPMYTVGEVTEDGNFKFTNQKGEKPVDLKLIDMFGKVPQTIMTDETLVQEYSAIAYDPSKIHFYLEQLLKLEAVACKDWLTNKVDRSGSGLVAKQQTVGALQLPLNNCGVMAIDYRGKEGVATSIGHSPISGLIDPVAGSRNSIMEALTNLIWAPLDKGLQSVSLSANWMWPANNKGEDARLYAAVQSLAEFAISLGINIPTGKDSLSMKQVYEDREVIAPGTVVISTVAHCSDIRKVVEPVLDKQGGAIYYINFSQDEFKLGGSSFGQVLQKIGKEAPGVKHSAFVVRAFNKIQELIKEEQILAGHDVGSGGLIVSLLEMCFAENNLAAEFDLTALQEEDTVKLLFNENAGIVFQSADDSVEEVLKEAEIEFYKIGKAVSGTQLKIKNGTEEFSFSIPKLRDLWFETSYLLDKEQSGSDKARERYQNYKTQELSFKFPKTNPSTPASTKLKAAVLREKGSHSEREMARALYLAGFEVKDVHMTDLIAGREDLQDVRFIAAVGGATNSDVLGAAKGWAGAFKYNEKANRALQQFFDRDDVLSLGIGNGCQLFMELGLLTPHQTQKPTLLKNESDKFESGFIAVEIPENNSIMLRSLSGSRLGVWSSHGQGKFSFPYSEEQYNIVGRFGYDQYPANPNGSEYNTAFLADDTGRHLVSMMHFERSIFPWSWPFYPKDRRNDETTPWLAAFINAREWLENH